MRACLPPTRRAAVATLTVFGLATAMTADSLQETTPHIVVSGHAELRVEPDLALVTLGVTHDAPRADTAQAKVNAVAGEILNSVSELGIGPGEAQTSRLSIHPLYERDEKTNRQVSVGFRASNTVTVRVANLDLVGPVIDAAVAVGGNEVQGISFLLEDDAAVQLHALQQAVADARAKAEAMASALGTPLGRVLTASDSGARVRPVFQEARAFRAASDAAAPVAQGKVTVEADVSLVYALGSGQ